MCDTMMVHRPHPRAPQMLARLLQRVDRERVVLLVKDDLADRRIKRSGLNRRTGGDEDHVDTLPAAPPLAELKPPVHVQRISIHGRSENP
jgi:hypothetical protein